MLPNFLRKLVLANGMQSGVVFRGASSRLGRTGREEGKRGDILDKVVKRAGGTRVWSAEGA